ncbi:unnamed protein product [Trichogramma brassicae]|uniref:trypsin n=1 Tax=Trichogramma brassicae TaxID=86971 RepID=A0A6H5IJA5_9HYME|nr:unnamed protein product [Trichogramma brassicae]
MCRGASIAILLCSIVFYSGCDAKKLRIVDGARVNSIKDYPFQASLHYGLFGHLCGASIINKRYLLTAGHCVHAYGDPDQLYVRAGTSYAKEGGTIHRVAKVIRHPEYTVNEYGNPMDDIALIKLEDPIVYDKKRRAIKLYKQNEKTRVGAMASLAGWGVTMEFQTPFQLQSVELPIIDSAVCDEAYRELGGLPHKQICAGYLGVGGKDSCQGDSGGPLVIGKRLAGIISWGLDCAQPDYPGAYTEIAAYRDWIAENMANN